MKTVCPGLVPKCSCGRSLCKAVTPRKKISDRTICDGDEYETECLIYIRSGKS